MSVRMMTRRRYHTGNGGGEGAAARFHPAVAPMHTASICCCVNHMLERMTELLAPAGHRTTDHVKKSKPRKPEPP
jgi:hypothetical protein